MEELICHNGDWAPAYPLDGKLRGRVFVPPADLPDPCYVFKVEALLQAGAVPPDTAALPELLLDVCGRYSAYAGYDIDVNNQTGTVSDPNPGCYSKLTPLWMKSLSKTGDLVTENIFPRPISISASRGDLLAIEVVGSSSSPAYSFPLIYRLYYLRPGTYTPNDESLLPSLYGGPLPPAGVQLGTWNDVRSGNGRTVMGSAGFPFAGLRFIAPVGATGVKQVSARVFDVLAGYGVNPGPLHMEIWSDSGGSPSVKLGQSATLTPSTIPLSGPGQYDFNFTSPPAVTPGMPYWVVWPADSVGSDWETTISDAAYISSRGTSITGLGANNLPGGEQWRLRIVC